MNKKPHSQNATSWSHYWAKTPSASTGCLPDLPASVSNHIRNIWWHFFESLPPAAHLLDLGCGNGAVLLQAKSRRTDLQLTGVDYASTLPDLGNEIVLHSETRFEELPFAQASMNAITSQFAIEYGTLAKTVGEVLRVLSEDGDFLFICHHADSPIVSDNTRRFAAIQAMLTTTGLLPCAINVVGQGKKSTPGTRHRLARIFTAVQRKFPEQSVIHEVASDIVRIMDVPQSLEKLLALRRNVQLEEERIAALQHAALTPNRAQALAGMLSSEKRPTHLDIVHVPGVSQPFAWRISSQLQTVVHSDEALPEA